MAADKGPQHVVADESLPANKGKTGFGRYAVNITYCRRYYTLV